MLKSASTVQARKLSTEDGAGDLAQNRKFGLPRQEYTEGNGNADRERKEKAEPHHTGQEGFNAPETNRQTGEEEKEDQTCPAEHEPLQGMDCGKPAPSLICEEHNEWHNHPVDVAKRREQTVILLFRREGFEIRVTLTVGW